MATQYERSERRSPKRHHYNTMQVIKHPNCIICDRTADKVELVAHHIYPISLLRLINRLDLELDDRNIRTICEDKKLGCHYLFAHYQDWKSYNPDIDEFADMFKNSTVAEILESSTYQSALTNRPCPIHMMPRTTLNCIASQLADIMPIKLNKALKSPSHMLV